MSIIDSSTCDEGTDYGRKQATAKRVFLLATIPLGQIKKEGVWDGEHGDIQDEL